MHHCWCETLWVLLRWLLKLLISRYFRWLKQTKKKWFFFATILTYIYYNATINRVKIHWGLCFKLSGRSIYQPSFNNAIWEVRSSKKTGNCCFSYQETRLYFVQLSKLRKKIYIYSYNFSLVMNELCFFGFKYKFSRSCQWGVIL